MAPSTHTNNYTLGRGEVWFSRFTDTVNYIPEGFRYIGNTPEMSLTIESEDLPHYSSDAGIREKDDSVPLEVNRTGSLTTDNINPENVSLFFFGVASVQTTAGSTGNTDQITNVILDRAYMIGATPTNPAGVFGIDVGGTNTVEVGATTMVEGTDYTIDYEAGMITFLSGGTIAADDTVDITYDMRANTRSRVISGSQPVEGAMLYRTVNPKGEDCTFYFPYVKISPNGDYALKGDDWQQIPMTLEVLKLPTVEAIYRDGDPVYS